jgi:hypothetical protein
MTVEPEQAAARAWGIPMAVWRELDWRMLLPTGDLGRLLYVGGPSQPLVAALKRVARDVLVVAPTAFAQRAFDFSGEVDTLVLSRPAAGADSLARAFSTLRPAGWLVLSVRQRRWTSQRTWPLRLRRCGFTSVSVYWHAPSFERCSYLVSLDDRTAVRAVLARYQGVRFGREKALAVRALLNAGAISLLARDTTFVAQRPAP